MWSRPFRGEAPFGAQGLSSYPVKPLPSAHPPISHVCIMASESGMFLLLLQAFKRLTWRKAHICYSVVYINHFYKVDYPWFLSYHEVSMCTLSIENIVEFLYSTQQTRKHMCFFTVRTGKYLESLTFIEAEFGARYPGGHIAHVLSVSFPYQPYNVNAMCLCYGEKTGIHRD